MGFWTAGKPGDERELQKRRDFARSSAGTADAYWDREEKSGESSQKVTTDRGVGKKPGWETWKYPLRKDGTRREGPYERKVARDATGRFVEHFDLEKFKKRHGLR